MRAGARWAGCLEGIWGVRDMVQWGMMRGVRPTSLWCDEGQDGAAQQQKGRTSARSMQTGSCEMD